MKEVDTVTMKALLNECDESGKEEEDNLSLSLKTRAENLLRCWMTLSLVEVLKKEKVLENE